MKRLYSHHPNRSIRAAATLVWVTLMLSPAPGLAAPAAIHNLGTLGGTNSNGRAVNNAGQVAGASYLTGNGTFHAFRYDGMPGSGGVMRDLGTLGGADSIAAGVNNAGQVAGWSYIAGNPFVHVHAFRYDGTPGAGGVMRDLGTLGGANSEARGVNDAGQVVGISTTSTGNTAYHAFRYDGTPGAGGVMRDLGTFGGAESYGSTVNAAGQVAGYSYIAEFEAHAFRYDGTPGAGGVMRDLGTFGGTYSYGWGINNAGQVAGSSAFVNNSHYHAFRYDGTPGAGGVMRDLGDLGGVESYGIAINDAGQVVGSSTINGTLHAFLYTGTPGAGGQMIDLDAWLDANNPAEGAKWTLNGARGISNTGWITGTGSYDPDGLGGVAAADRAYLLDATSLVPEPSGLALLALAVPALLRRRHHSRQRQAIGRACCETLEGRRLLSFSPAVNYATIGTPSAIVTADLNNDGKLDLVTCANAVTGSFSVFLGNGAGGFGAAQRTVMGTQLSSMAAADFNNDGKIDLVVSDNYDYGFDFLAGNGDGTFQPPVYTASGAVAAVGRFNGDSYTDVLIARLGPDWEIQFQVYCGDGQGGFAAVGTDLWYYGSGRTAVDLNNDGKLDVVTAEGYVFPGNGDGTFQFDWEQPALLDGGTIATGDFTGDGKVDAIVAGNNKVSVLRGRGDGTFDAPITQALAGNPHTGVATADFNGDGKLDAVVSSYDTGDVRLMLGNGDGTLRDAGAFATGTSPSGVVVGDFNRDGRPDVAVSNAASRTVSVLLNDGVWAGSKTFTGPGGNGSGGNWSNNNNWSPPGVPTASDYVSIAGKSVNLTATAVAASVSLTGGAKLDLNDAGLILTGDTLTNVRNLVVSGCGGVGFANQTWDGPGIMSTRAQGDPLSNAVGYLDNDNFIFGPRSTFKGVSVPDGSILLMATIAGDADLNGTVDDDDVTILGSMYGTATGAHWFGADFDFNGTVDDDDVTVLGLTYGTSSGSHAFDADVVQLADDRERAYVRLVEGADV